MNALRSTTTAALGAACMYFWDPRSGRRRRARARGAIDHALRASIRGLDLASRDLLHRLHGALVASRGRRVQPDDDVLAERVRARLGRLCSRPHAIGVFCASGRVQLGGPVLEAEVPRIVAGVRAIPGVVEIVDGMDRHVSGDVPGLLDAVPRSSRRRGPLPAYWSPALRLVAGAAGITLVASGLRRGGAIGLLQALAGGAMAARSLTNVALGALFGVGACRHAVDVTKTLTVRAEPEHAFTAFTAFESFPRFMRHVREVTKVDDNRWHFKVRGPAGMTFEWDGILMRLVRGEFVSWTSAESASIRHTGSARFERRPGGTRVTVRLSYEPPLGLLGHEIARLLGADPKHELEEDLASFKSLLEQGKATGARGTITREQVLGGAP